MNPATSGAESKLGITCPRRAKSAYIHALREIRTREALHTALDQTMHVFHLNRSDDMGMRGSAPALMIRLGKDQEAYDFIKWHATSDPDGRYDWGDMSLPFLDLHDEKIFELVEVLMRSEYSLESSHTIALTLIKLRLLLDLHSLKQSQAASVASELPQELVDTIRKDLVSGAVARHPEILQEVRDGGDISPWLQEVESQVIGLCDKIRRSNRYFWSAMAEPGRHLTARPEYSSMGSEDEMQVYIMPHGRRHPVRLRGWKIG